MEEQWEDFGEWEDTGIYYQWGVVHGHGGQSAEAVDALRARMDSNVGYDSN